MTEENEQTVAQLTAALNAERIARKHTQKWYARHYGKLEDWARKRLPDPWVKEFFNCVANGTWWYGESEYFRVDTAAGQLIIDQTRRAEEAEAERDALRSELARMRTCHCRCKG